MNNSYTYQPLRYYALAFAATFVFWIIGAYISFQESESFMIFMILGGMSPFLVSAWMTFTSNNAGLKKEFFDRLVNLRRVRPGSLPVFFLLMPAVVVVSITLSLPFGGSIDQFRFAEGFSFSAGAVPVLLFLFMAAAFEELGWRGYAFDSLASRFSVIQATLVFGAIWSVWHLPLIFVKDSYQYEVFTENAWYGVNFFASMVPLGVIITWICIKNNKSFPAAILFHLIVNMSQELLSMTQTTKCIETFVLVAVAAAILLVDRKAFAEAYPPPARVVQLHPAPAA